MSKLLKEILKSSILPACLMITSKLVGIYLALIFFGYNVFIENENSGLFTVQLYLPSQHEALRVNTFSNLFMFGIFALIYIYILSKYYLFNDANKNPRTIIKLTKLNILKWVTNKETNFLKTFVWGNFLWITCFINIVSAANQESSLYAGIIGAIALIVSAWLLIRAFEIESEKVYPKEDNSYI